jgi:hypothetical protein
VVSLDKNTPQGYIGEVPLKDKPGGKIIGTAKLEKVGSTIMAHVDMADIPEAMIKGFSFGHVSMYEVENKDGR